MISKVVILSSVFFLVAVALTTEEREKIFARAVGPCIDDRCQSKHECFYGQCVPQGIAPAMPEFKAEQSIGPCMNGGLCPGNNFCHKAKCFPL